MERGLWLLIGLLLCADRTLAKAGLCEVEGGQSNIILDIEESRGTQISQETMPRDLPVVGDPFSDIALDLVFPKGKAMFILNGKKLQLLSPLDRDQDNLSHIVFQLTCTVKSSNKKRTIPVILTCTVKSSNKKRTIPVIVRVSDVNDNAPMFVHTPYETTVSELTPVGTTIFQGLRANDLDAGVNGLVEYSIVPGDGRGLGTDQGVGRDRVNVADGFEYFAINLPHQGQVTVNRSLDYEKTQRYLVTIVATDRARNHNERYSTTTTLTVNIRDDDDQDPSFIYQGCMLLDGSCINPEYYSTVSSGVLAGILAITPEKIQAVDMDSINSPIMYSFLSGSPSSFREYFEINPSTGAVRQVKPVDTSVAKIFEIIVKAEEVSESRRFATAKLLISVKPRDSSPPKISSTAAEGFVDENSAIGTKVIDSEGNPIMLTVSDADLGPDDPKPPYSFELTTSFFQINEEGTLVVAEENLERDPPSPGKFRFQVVAREKTGSAASPPVTLTVILNDVNDNAPRLPMIPPITVQAGEGRREIVKVVATDNDLGVNAEISYSIYHVSNNGRNKFKIDAQSGAIEAIGKLNAAEQYSITVQATDHGGKYSQTIVEVTVVPGPNTRSPVFQQSSYQVTVSEGAPINSSVATILALDPENDPVSYSIISGNDLRQFGIDDKTGVLSVIRRLDREDLTRYELLIKAEDEGGLSSTATVNIVVSDINDKNPEFVDEPYEFSVEEGLVGALVGRVKATDSDEGINALVSYSLPHDVPFMVDESTGEIKTRAALDYETIREYRFVVTAKDGASEPRIATATVVINVTDIEDEEPIFHRTSYEASVPENVPNFLVTHVVANDPDTRKQITYMIRQGPADLFSIDQMGTIRTLQGLDYERDSQHVLVIGTKENMSNKPGATTKVIIYVQDRNDIPPVFLTVPRPITLDDNVAINTLVTTVAATDSDGTAPGNKVRYEIVGRGKAPRYFHIDTNLGEIHVRDDLRKEPDNEYQVDVKAYDLGDPQLSTIISVPVFIRHIATVPPDIGLGFSDDSYTIEIPEDTPQDALVKMFSVINGRTNSHTVPFRCSITSGNEAGMFSIGITEDRNCELRLLGKIDHEKQPEYLLKLQLDTLAGLANPARTSTTVKIQVIDLNDNIPLFVYPETSKYFKKDKYFGAIARDRKEVGGPVIQVKATDKDGGGLGQVEYRLIPDETQSADYFAIDPSTGIIRTKRGLDTIPAEKLPLRLKVEARDDPGHPDNSNVVFTEVVINMIEEQSRLILVIDDKAAGEVTGQEQEVAGLLGRTAGLLVGVERVSARQYTQDNMTLETDQAATDLWFYAIDPITEKILLRNSTKVKRSLLSPEALGNITMEVAATLQASASVIHPPIQVTMVRTAVVAVQWELFPYTLIIIAALILILGTAGIVYICISWSRYKAYKERMQRMYVVPSRYDPVFVEPNLKEYETQVLQMSVPLDDNDSYNDLQLDFSRKNHAFTLDNVSYITKDNGDSIGQQSPVSSDAATTTRASSLVGHHNNVNNNNIHQPGILNPAYDKSEDERGLNSSTNENVTFREKKDYSHLGFNYLIDRSPIETTTEL